eukprot:12527846-Alexandrium_andersonii.AAC.1
MGGAPLKHPAKSSTRPPPRPGPQQLRTSPNSGESQLARSGVRREGSSGPGRENSPSHPRPGDAGGAEQQRAQQRGPTVTPKAGEDHN